MKKTLSFIIIFLLAVSSGFLNELIAQDDIYATAGRTKVLQWKSAGDYSAYSLLFVAVNSSDERVIQKDLIQSYALGYTTMVCTLYVSDTEDLTADASYDYDIAAYGTDTVTVRRGKLNLIDPIQTSFNGTALPGGTRVTTVSLDNGTIQDETVIWDTTQNKWIPSGSIAGLVSKKIYGVVVNGTVTSWNVSNFITDATYSISGDTLIISDASGELNLAGMILTNNQDYTIVGTPTTSEIKIQWGGFAGKTISFIWQIDALMQ